MTRHFWQRCATWGLTIVLLTSGGCSFFPEALQPHNLQKLNRGPAPSGNGDPFLSIPDPIPAPSEDADQAVESDEGPLINQAD